MTVGARMAVYGGITSRSGNAAGGNAASCSTTTSEGSPATCGGSSTASGASSTMSSSGSAMAVAANTTFGSNPTYTAVRAGSASAYGPYTGDGSSAQQVASYYTTAAANKTNGWLPTAPTGAYTYVCRGSEAAMYPCPPSPPAANPPPPLISSSLCEYRRSAGRGHARLLP